MDSLHLFFWDTQIPDSLPETGPCVPSSSTRTGSDPSLHLRQGKDYRVTVFTGPTRIGGRTMGYESSRTPESRLSLFLDQGPLKQYSSFSTLWGHTLYRPVTFRHLLTSIRTEVRNTSKKIIGLHSSPRSNYLSTSLPTAPWRHCQMWRHILRQGHCSPIREDNILCRGTLTP